MSIYFTSHPEVRHGYFASSEIHFGGNQTISVGNLPYRELPPFLLETFSPQVSLVTHIQFLEEAIEVLELWKNEEIFLFFSEKDLTPQMRKKLSLLFHMINITLYNLSFKTSAQIHQELIQGSEKYFDENPLPTQ